MKSLFSVLVCLAAVFPLFDCASSSIKMVSYHSRMLLDADSLFSLGNYDEALAVYNKIRSAKPATDEAKTAHFQCGYINIYFKNPNANWGVALKEFKSFTTTYPNDPRVSEALSWVRVLTVMKSFDNQSRSSADQVERLEYFKKEAFQSRRTVLDSMNVLLRNSTTMRDSMTNANLRLENVIIDLEKKCQQAGR